jgi:hypothetical protein
MTRKQLAVACLLMLTASPAAAADWLRVETPNFVLFSQTGEKRSREVAVELERFREAIRHVLPGGSFTSPVPTIVVIFENQRAFSPYRPQYNGKPVSLGGYFVGSEVDNMIAMTVDHRGEALRTIFHEYTHLITSKTSGAVPTWVTEGIAEFYSTFSVSRDGRKGVLGRIIPSHYGFLWRHGLMPLDALLGVDDSSALYNEGQRRSTFYAQSWAMVHMLLAGKPDRSKELGEYLRLAAAGLTQSEAWARAFGTLDVNRDLRRYLRNFPLPSFEYTFEEQIAVADAKVSRAGTAEVEAVLAALLRYAKPEDVESALQRAAGSPTQSKLAPAILGFTKVRNNRPKEEALGLLLDAAKDKSDWLVQYYVASGLTEIVRRSFDRSDNEIVAAALAAVNAALAVRPDLPHAIAMKADLEDDLTGAARARSLAPGREDYVFIEARLRAEADDVEGARRLLEPLLRSSVPAEIRDAARRLLRQINQRGGAPDEMHSACRHCAETTRDGPPGG